MITVWRMPIVATVEHIVKDIKLQLYGTGLLREVNDTGSDLMVTCPFHGGGKEHNPSCGISKQEKTVNGKHYEAGTVHCFTCGYTADLPQFVADMLGLSNPLAGYKWLVGRYNYSTKEREPMELMKSVLLGIMYERGAKAIGEQFDKSADWAQQLIDDFHQSIPSKPQEPQDVIIEVKDLSFAYQSDHQILDNVSFEIRKGEKIAIVGKNGAGKSTIAKLLCGILRPTKGQILLKGQDYMQYSIKEIGGMIGYVMQNPNQMIVKDMIKDEVALGLTLHDYSKEDIEKNVEEALKMCNLYAMRNWPVSALSYGQKKRVTIASILAMKPDVMILDEPTAGQDYRVYTEIMTFLDYLNKEYGITILFITHDMHLAIEYTDRAIVFSEGTCIGDDSVFKILSDEDIIQRAHLKQTSLFTLAKRIGLPCDAFTQHFIEHERMNRHE